MAPVYSLFYILRVSVIYYSAYSFQISTIAFFIAAARYITKSDGISNLTIQGQALKTKSIKIRPFRPAILLIALKAISVIIIQQAYRSGPWQRSTILMELCDLTKTNFIVIPKVIAQYLNFLLTKFFPTSIVIKSGSPKQLSIQYIYKISQVCLTLISHSHLLV